MHQPGQCAAEPHLTGHIPHARTDLDHEAWIVRVPGWVGGASWAGAAVDPIAVVGTPLPTGPLTAITVAATTITTAATTTGLPIVDQAACP